MVGFIYIKITANTFEISNTGEKPLDRERIFERFYQGQKKERINRAWTGFSGFYL